MSRRGSRASPGTCEWVETMRGAQRRPRAGFQHTVPNTGPPRGWAAEPPSKVSPLPEVVPAFPALTALPPLGDAKLREERALWPVPSPVRCARVPLPASAKLQVPSTLEPAVLVFLPVLLFHT